MSNAHFIVMQYIGRVGVVNTVQDSGDIIVRYSNNKIFLINQLALTKVTCGWCVYTRVHAHEWKGLECCSTVQLL